MIPDGKGLVVRQLHIAHDQPDGLFPVAEGQGVVEVVDRHLLPDAVVVLDVAEPGLIAADLAQIMEQGNDGHALLVVVLSPETVDLLDPAAGQIGVHAVIDVEAVLAESSRTGGMIPGAGRRFEEIRGQQEVEQVLGALPVNKLPINLDKPFFGIHNLPPCEVFFSIAEAGENCKGETDFSARCARSK